MMYRMIRMEDSRDKDTEVRSIAHVLRKERRRLVEFNGIDKVTWSL
jgi:hypothetical protein